MEVLNLGDIFLGTGDGHLPRVVRNCREGTGRTDGASVVTKGIRHPGRRR